MDSYTSSIIDSAFSMNIPIVETDNYRQNKTIYSLNFARCKTESRNALNPELNW